VVAGALVAAATGCDVVELAGVLPFPPLVATAMTVIRTMAPKTLRMTFLTVCRGRGGLLSLPAVLPSGGGGGCGGWY
jgi:hypothetical protein